MKNELICDFYCDFITNTQGIKHRMGESQDSFLTQETMTEKGAQKKCCQWNRKTMTITASVSFALVLCLVVLIIRFHANVRPDEKYASVGTIPFPAVTVIHSPLTVDFFAFNFQVIMVLDLNMLLFIGFFAVIYCNFHRYFYIVQWIETFLMNIYLTSNCMR